VAVVNDIFTFYAPNAFSPNDDNVNPVFLPTGEAWDNNTFTMWIYDRWGNLAFKSTDVTKGWDGRYRSKGDEAQEDTYIWKVQVNDIFGRRHDYHGVVNLLK
jgi:gliding motility-associated-like protein